MEISHCAGPESGTRHRIESPNSSPRAIAVACLGSSGPNLASRLRSHGFQGVQVAVLETGNTRAIVETLQSLDNADTVIVVASDASDVSLALQIKQAVRNSRVMVTGILIQKPGHSDSPDGLAEFRAASDMLIMAANENYVVDMLVELGA